MQKEAIQARVSQIQWLHNYELLPGIMTDGLNPTTEEARSTLFQIPQDLQGKRVLDVGCADGYYSFLAESRGASVVAIDARLFPGFALAHEVRNSKVEFHQTDVYNLQPNTFGTFDIVFFLGVYYHLKNPILALERIASVTRELAIIESHVMTMPGYEDIALSRFYEPEELMPGDPTNRWVPNVPCLLQTVRAAGFPQVEFIGGYANNQRGIVHARKGIRTAAKMLTEDFICTIHTPPANTEVNGTVQISGVAFSKLKRAGGIERITVYLDKLDDPAAELGVAEFPLENGSWRESIAASLAGETYGPIGFEFRWNSMGVTPGSHTLYILAEGQLGWQYAAKPIIVVDGSPGKFSTRGPQLEVNKARNEVSLPRRFPLENNSSAPGGTEPDELARLGKDIDVRLSTEQGWPLLDKVRRTFHYLVIYYVNMMANKQKAFNQATADLLKQIVASQRKVEPEIAALQEEIIALRTEIQALRVKLAEAGGDSHEISTNQS